MWEPIFVIAGLNAPYIAIGTSAALTALILFRECNGSRQRHQFNAWPDVNTSEQFPAPQECRRLPPSSPADDKKGPDMTHTYDANRDPRAEAADAMLRAIALYKAAGYTRSMLGDCASTFWDQTPAARPIKGLQNHSKPGHPECIARGCLCPPGQVGEQCRDGVGYDIDPDCPIHAHWSELAE